MDDESGKVREEPEVREAWKKAFVPPKSSVEPTLRWVRVKLGGEFVADSKRALLLIEYGPGKLPTYCFPTQDVRMEMLEEQAGKAGADRIFYAVRAGEKMAANGAWMFVSPPEGFEALKGYVTFDWGKMDGWYEEAEEVFVHARDPYKRVDVQRSSRRVKVMANGIVLAETERPALLFETSLPTRYYIPAEDVNMELLEESNAVTECPYKGRARYCSARVGDEVLRNVVWCYEEPIAECPKIRGMLCFFNERVDMYVDGVLEERPVTPWSR
jgi:uncharacterized protein (DUF427 family)